MNRRSFIAALAAVPVVGRLVTKDKPQDRKGIACWTGSGWLMMEDCTIARDAAAFWDASLGEPWQGHSKTAWALPSNGPLYEVEYINPLE